MVALAGPTAESICLVQELELNVWHQGTGGPRMLLLLMGQFCCIRSAPCVKPDSLCSLVVLKFEKPVLLYFCYRPLKGCWLIWAVVIINNDLGFIWPHNEWQRSFLCMSVYCCELLYDMGVWKKYWSGIFLCSMFCGQWLLLVWQRTVIESISLARRIQVPAAVMQHMNCNC